MIKLNDKKQMNLSEYKLLNFFFVFAFLIAGISPACAFVSGKANTIEICSSDGTLKTIELPDDQGGNSPKIKKKNDCAFCFTNSNIAKTTTELFVLNHRFVNCFDIISAEYLTIKPIVQSYFNPRAPPPYI